MSTNRPTLETDSRGRQVTSCCGREPTSEVIDGRWESTCPVCGGVVDPHAHEQSSSVVDRIVAVLPFGAD